MSERRLFSLGRRTLACGALALLAARADALGAQTAAELRARHDSVKVRYAAAQLALDIAENRARAVPDDSLMLHGAVLRFNAANLDERERRSLTRAFDDAASELIDLFGPDGVSLMRGQQWLATVQDSRARGQKRSLVLEARDGTWSAASGALDVPLNVPEATAIVRRHAGRALANAQPRIRMWVGGAFAIAEPTQTHYFAHRHLALHQSTPARRCARGNIAACSDILNPNARDRWFEPTDDANEERVPASGVVRESLLRYAVDVDGPAMLRAFQSAPDSTTDAFLFLVRAVGQEPQEFLTGWQATLSESGAVRVKAPNRHVVIALAWFGFLGFVATRRRPQ